MGLRNKTIKGFFWSTFSEVIAKVLSPIAFLILTRILSPADFGVIAVATTILMFVNVVCDMGTSKVLIQIDCDKNLLNQYCNVSFWFNGVVGLIIFLIVYIYSDKIAELYSQPQSADVIKVMSIQIIMYSLSSVQTALMKRNLNFKTLFFLRLITVVSPLIISIPVAFLGGGYWAIVCGSVSGSILSTIALWCRSHWKPSFLFQIRYLKPILSKSIWNTIDQLFIWIPICLDTYLIPKFLTSADLGMYTTSRSLFSSATGIVLTPLLTVMFSSLSRITNTPSYRNVVLISQKIFFSASFFISIFVFLFQDYISAILFTSKWDGISSILGWMFLLMGCEYFNSIILESLRAKGLFKMISINTIVSVCISVPCLFIGVKYGIVSYVLTRCGCLYINYLGIFLLSKKYNNISFIDCINNNIRIIIIGVIMFISFFCVYATDFISAYYRFTILIITYIAMLMFILWKEKIIVQTIKQIIKPKL